MNTISVLLRIDQLSSFLLPLPDFQHFQETRKERAEEGMAIRSLKNRTRHLPVGRQARHCFGSVGSNRNIQELESTPSHRKQTAALRSNRTKTGNRFSSFH